MASPDSAAASHTAASARRVAIVTGVNPGNLGHAIALRFAQEGMAVMMADLDPKVAEVSAEIAMQAGMATRLAHHVGDLSDEATVVALIDETVRRFGRVDILVNGAGRGVILPFLAHTGETMTATLQRNLWTTLWCCHKVLPHMVSQNHGRIINIGADSLRTGIPDHAVYNAAKGGVIGMMVALAREFASYDITINAVSPCVLNTPPYRHAMATNPERTRKFIAVVPKGRPAEMDEVVDMVAFLAREEARFITGQDFSINGGSAMP